jgi:hypothetical protein
MAGEHIVSESSKIYYSDKLILTLEGDGDSSWISLDNTTGIAINIPLGHLVLRNLKITTSSILTSINIQTNGLSVYNSILWVSSGINPYSSFDSTYSLVNFLTVENSRIYGVLNPIQVIVSSYVSDRKLTAVISNSEIEGAYDILNIVTTDGASGGNNIHIDSIVITNSKLVSQSCLGIDNHSSNSSHLYVDSIIVDKCFITGIGMFVTYCDPTKLVYFGSIKIHNSTYLPKSGAGTAFFVGIIGLDNSNISELSLSDLVLDYSSISDPLNNTIKSTCASAWMTDGEWGALTLMADKITLNNIWMKYVASGSRHADILIYKCIYLDSKNVSIYVDNKAGTTYPKTRVWVFPLDGYVGRIIDNLNIIFNNSDGTHQYATESALRVTPSGQLSICNSNLKNIGRYGNSFSGVDVRVGLYPNPVNFSGLTLSNNKIDITGKAVTAINAFLNSTTEFNCKIINNQVINTQPDAETSTTCYIFISAGYGNIDILGNSATYQRVYGDMLIYVYPNSNSNVSEINISSNTLSVKTMGEFTYMQVRGDNSYTFLRMLGNSCHFIKLTDILPVASGHSRDANVVGLETGYQVDSGWAVPKFEHTGLIVHNIATLLLA